MAVMKAAKTPQQIKRLGVAATRDEYNDLAKSYNSILDYKKLLCPVCGSWEHAKEGFYSDQRTVTGRFPICKSCIKMIVEQKRNKNDEPNETKESVQYVCQLMDIPYIDSFYEDCVEGTKDPNSKFAGNAGFIPYITSIKSLPNWKGKTWKDSEFPEEEEEIYEDSVVRKPRKNIIKLFGSGFTDSDYLYLQDQYDEWVARTQVDSKSQETYIVRICFKLLDIWKAQKEGKDTKDLDKSLNDLMAAANLQPKQNKGNEATDSLSFGELIQRWEEERPITETDPEFKDVDGIGKYIRVFFAGHLGKAVGLKNAYTDEYDEYMKDYTVDKPEFTEDGGSEEIYDKLFGSEGD